jgi:glycerophosphoryl diester phosphodiesterase
MIRILVALLIVSSLALGAFWAWYKGDLADFYARYPDRAPLVTTAPNFEPFVIAHRGDSHAAPENTVAAIRTAIANNLDYVEIDVRLTADGVPVLLHDVDVDRTTDGEGLLTDFSFAELRKLDAGSWFGQAYTGERVPTLEEALAAARGGICVLADVKAAPNRKIVHQLKSFAGQEPRFCLLVNIGQSTNGAAILDMDMPAETREKLVETYEQTNKKAEDSYGVFRRYWPEFPQVRALRALETPQALVEKYPQLVALEFRGMHMSEDIVRAAHQLGLLTYSRATEANMETDANFRVGLTAGVDGFFVSQVDLLRDFVSRLQNAEGS